jgi:hypothetical protein
VVVPAFTGLTGTTATADPGPEGVSMIAEVGAALGAEGSGGPGSGGPGSGGPGSGGPGSGGDVSGGGPEDAKGGGENGTDLVRIVTTAHSPHLLWVHEHLQHLSDHLQAIGEPATHVAEQRREPWWR